MNRTGLEASSPASSDGAEPEPSTVRSGADALPEAVTPLLRGHGGSRCQVHRVSIRIPVLPHGPLSVHRFYLQAGNTIATNGIGQRTWNKDQPDPVALDT